MQLGQMYSCPFSMKITKQNVKYSWLSKHKIRPYSVFGGFLRRYLNCFLHLQHDISITWQPLASKCAFRSIHFCRFSSCSSVRFFLHGHPWYLHPLYSQTVSTPLITAYPSTRHPKKCSTVHFVQKCTTVHLSRNLPWTNFSPWWYACCIWTLYFVCSYCNHCTAEKLVCPWRTYFRNLPSWKIHLKPGPNGIFCICDHKYIELKSKNSKAVYKSPFGAILDADGLSVDVKFISLKTSYTVFEQMDSCPKWTLVHYTVPMKNSA